MAVRIRMSRMGRTNRPYWRIIAVDSRKKRDGEYLDKLGTYDPIKHKLINLDFARVDDWIKKGAICSKSVIKLMKIHGSTEKVLPSMAAK